MSNEQKERHAEHSRSISPVIVNELLTRARCFDKLSMTFLLLIQRSASVLAAAFLVAV